MRAGSLFWLIAAALALIGALARLNGAPTRLGAPLSCSAAQLWGGALRCEGEVAEDLGELCGRDVSGAIGPGDAIGVAACACARAPGLEGFGLACPEIERMGPESLAALRQPVEINTASAADLASLPGIGPAFAERIIAGRPYATVDDLLEVRGIGPKRLAKLRPRARVAPP